jgi:hypothetical protein
MLIPMAISIAMTRSIIALLLVIKRCAVLQRNHQTISGQLQKEFTFLQRALLDDPFHHGDCHSCWLAFRTSPTAGTIIHTLDYKWVQLSSLTSEGRLWYCAESAA